MDKINNDELGFDSTLSPEVINLLWEASKDSDSKTAPERQSLDEYEQVLAD